MQGGGGSSVTGTFIPPSHLHLPPYGYALQPYSPPFDAPPPPLRFPPHPASLSNPNGYPSIPGQRHSFTSLEEASSRGDEGQESSAQKRKLGDSAEGDDVDELESDAGSQHAAVAGWAAQVQASLSGGGSWAGEQDEEKPKAKKPKAARGVQPVNPYNIPTVSQLGRQTID